MNTLKNINDLDSRDCLFNHLKCQESLLRLIEYRSRKNNFPLLKGNQFNVYKFIWRSKASYPLFPWAPSKCILDPPSLFPQIDGGWRVHYPRQIHMLLCHIFSRSSHPFFALRFNWPSVISRLGCTCSFQSNDTKANFTPTSRSV